MKPLWFCSIVDKHKPEGEGFIGAVIREAADAETAMDEVSRMFPETCLEILTVPIPPEDERTARSNIDQLLSKTTIESLFGPVERV